MRVRPARHHLRDVGAVSGDVADEVGKDAGRGDDAQLAIVSGVGRRRAPGDPRRKRERCCGESTPTPPPPTGGVAGEEGEDAS